MSARFDSFGPLIQRPVPCRSNCFASTHGVAQPWNAARPFIIKLIAPCRIISDYPECCSISDYPECSISVCFSPWSFLFTEGSSEFLSLVFSSSEPMIEHVTKSTRQSLTIPVEGTRLEGILDTPPRNGTPFRGLILFAHGSGSSRLSPRNQFVAHELNRAGFVTLLFDLLTMDEDRVFDNRFDIPLLAKRLRIATHWQSDQQPTHDLPIGFFGASTGAAAALVAASELGTEVAAVVCRGGRPDLVGPYLKQVSAPTLLLIGELDTDVLALNEEAMIAMRCEKKLMIVPGATHLFEEPGTLEAVAHQSAEWFRNHMIKKR